MTDELEVGATVHRPPEDVYAFLRDVEGYGAYSEYVREVARTGDGGPGTEYAITLAWWRVSYTARLRVTDLDPPDRISWRVVEDLDASGAWHLEPAAVEDSDVDHATRVTLSVRFDPDSADDDALSRPPLVPTSTIVSRARPLVEREAERVLARVVADLEGESRDATLDVTVRSRTD